MEAFGVRYASLRSGAPLVAGAAIAALAALERNFDCFAPPVADHTAAAQILPPVPTAPSGLVAWCGGSAVSHPIRLLWRSRRPRQPAPLPRRGREENTFGASAVQVRGHSLSLAPHHAIVLARLQMSCDQKFWSLRQCTRSVRAALPLMQCRRGSDAEASVAAATYMRLYLGPLPPSRGVQRGPSTSVALQSTQLGAFTRRPRSTR